MEINIFKNLQRSNQIIINKKEEEKKEEGLKAEEEKEKAKGEAGLAYILGLHL
jgi:hypothetical protein